LKSLRTAAHQALLKALVRARARADLTQKELGRRLGRSQPWVSKVENGERRLDVLEFAELCGELNLRPGRVLGNLPRIGRLGTAKS
jgi:transcriptional regulator with XRE-family HTH domain